MFDRTRRLPRGVAMAGTVVLGAALLAGCGNGASHDQDSLDPKGPAARKILDLFTPFFWVAVVIGVGVVGGTILVALKFRERPGTEGNPKQTHGHTALEIGWTIVPALILAVMAVPTVATIFDLAEKPKGDVLEITVTAKQWWWQYEYAADGFMTANEMHIPVGRPVYLSLTAPPDGVIHSFWVPNLAGKKDVVPGRTHYLTIEADEPGTYLGQCAEYCGLSHANMRLRVIAESPADYQAWVERQQEPVSEAAAAYVSDEDGPIARFGCTSCHAFNGVEGASASIGPNLTHVGDRTTFAGAIFEMNFDNLWRWVFDAPGEKPAEKLKGWMPSFKEQGMTQEEAEEIARFLLCDTASDPSANSECGS